MEHLFIEYICGSRELETVYSFISRVINKLNIVDRILLNAMYLETTNKMYLK